MPKSLRSVDPGSPASAASGTTAVLRKTPRKRG